MNLNEYEYLNKFLSIKEQRQAIINFLLHKQEYLKILSTETLYIVEEDIEDIRKFTNDQINEIYYKISQTIYKDEQPSNDCKYCPWCILFFTNCTYNTTNCSYGIRHGNCTKDYEENDYTKLITIVRSLFVNNKELTDTHITNYGIGDYLYKQEGWLNKAREIIINVNTI